MAKVDASLLKKVASMTMCETPLKGETRRLNTDTQLQARNILFKDGYFYATDCFAALRVDLGERSKDHAAKVVISYDDIKHMHKDSTCMIGRKGVKCDEVIYKSVPDGKFPDVETLFRNFDEEQRRKRNDFVINPKLISKAFKAVKDISKSDEISVLLDVKPDKMQWIKLQPFSVGSGGFDCDALVMCINVRAGK